MRGWIRRCLVAAAALWGQPAALAAEAVQVEGVESRSFGSLLAWLRDTVLNDVVFPLLLLISVGALGWNLFKFATAGGNPHARADAQSGIMWAGIAIVGIAGIWVLTGVLYGIGQGLANTPR